MTELDFSAEALTCRACDTPHPAVRMNLLFGEEGISFTVEPQFAREFADELFKAVLKAESMK